MLQRRVCEFLNHAGNRLYGSVQNTEEFMTKAKQEKDFQTQADEYAKHAIENLQELLEACTEDDDSPVQEDPLSVEVRTGWYTPGSRSGATKPAESCILLGTGGPASRIVGTLDENGEPESTRFEYQDWGKPWTAARTTVKQEV